MFCFLADNAIFNNTINLLAQLPDYARRDPERLDVSARLGARASDARPRTGGKERGEPGDAAPKGLTERAGWEDAPGGWAAGALTGPGQMREGKKKNTHARAHHVCLKAVENSLRRLRKLTITISCHLLFLVCRFLFISLRESS